MHIPIFTNFLSHPTFLNLSSDIISFLLKMHYLEVPLKQRNWLDFER